MGRGTLRRRSRAGLLFVVPAVIWSIAVAVKLTGLRLWPILLGAAAFGVAAAAILVMSRPAKRS